MSHRIIVDDYGLATEYDAGLSIADLALRHNVSTITIQRHLNNVGVAMRSPGRPISINVDKIRTCRRCGVELSDANWWPSWKTLHSFTCIQCCRRKSREWYHENRERAMVTNKNWRIKNRAHDNLRRANFRRLHHDTVIVKERQIRRKSYWKNIEVNRKKKREMSKKQRVRHRCIVLEKLGGKCAMCGFADARVLQVDHLNSDGSKERRLKGVDGIYRSIMRMADPSAKYQLLCPNCNWIKRALKRELGTPRPLNNHGYNEYQRNWQRKNKIIMRTQILGVLGNKCVVCGNVDSRVLQIDHIHGGGKAEYERCHWRLDKFIYHLPIVTIIANYQLLCANCNWIKRYELQEDRKKAEPILSMRLSNPNHVGGLEYLHTSQNIPKMSDVDKAQLSTEYCSGASLTGLALKYNTSTTTIRYHLKRLHVPMRPWNGNKLRWLDKTQLKLEYERGATSTQLGNKYHVHPFTIRYHLRKLSVKMHSNTYRAPENLEGKISIKVK